MSKSLLKKYPKRKDIILLLGISFVLLTIGLSLPIMSVKQLLVWHESFSIWQGIGALIEERAYILASIIFFFSILFPYAKITAMGYIWIGPVTDEQRKQSMGWLKALAKWSMLDVFVVAILIVMNKTGGPISFSPKPGIYFFAASILLSIFISWEIDRIVRNQTK